MYCWLATDVTAAMLGDKNKNFLSYKLCEKVLSRSCKQSIAHAGPFEQNKSIVKIIYFLTTTYGNKQG